MKYFLIFLVVCFFFGTLFYRLNAKKRNLVLFLFCAVLAIAYYFFNKL